MKPNEAALETIVSGKASEPYEQFLLCLRIHLFRVLRDVVLADRSRSGLGRLEPQGWRSRAYLKSSGRTRRLTKFSGQPFHIALARPSGSFEFTYAELGLGTTSVTGDMEMAFRRFMGAFLCSPLQSGWLDPRKIKAYRLARSLSSRSHE